MSDTPGDPDIDRLSAADPAGPDPDLTALRARVLDAARGEPPTESRRPGRLIAGGIAAAVALLAAGTLAGVALGRATADDPILAIAEDSAEVPSVNDGPQIPSMGFGSAMGSPSSGVATEDARSSMIWPGYAESFEPAPDLVNTPGSAAAYRLSATGIDQAALASQLASVFDVVDQRVDSEGAVTIGVEGGPMIWVYDDAMVSWSFSDPTRDPWACGDTAPTSEAAGDVEPGIAQPCSPASPPIDESTARDQAEAILTTLGVTDTAGLSVGLDWETFTDGAVTTVTAWQTLDGARTQLSWSITFDSQGPIWANGFAAGLESVGDLPIVGARTAVLRSAEPRWKAFGPTPVDPMVMPMVEPRAQPLPESNADIAQRTASDQITIAWDPALVTGAEPAISQYWGPNGEFWLLPGYRLSTADDRGDWVVIAVAEIAVTFTP